MWTNFTTNPPTNPWRDSPVLVQLLAQYLHSINWTVSSYLLFPAILFTSLLPSTTMSLSTAKSSPLQTPIAKFTDLYVIVWLHPVAMCIFGIKHHPPMTNSNLLLLHKTNGDLGLCLGNWEYCKMIEWRQIRFPPSAYFLVFMCHFQADFSLLWCHFVNETKFCTLWLPSDTFGVLQQISALHFTFPIFVCVQKDHDSQILPSPTSLVTSCPHRPTVLIMDRGGFGGGGGRWHTPHSFL